MPHARTVYTRRVSRPRLYCVRLPTCRPHAADCSFAVRSLFTVPRRLLTRWALEPCLRPPLYCRAWHRPRGPRARGCVLPAAAAPLVAQAVGAGWRAAVLDARDAARRVDERTRGPPTQTRCSDFVSLRQTSRPTLDDFGPMRLPPESALPNRPWGQSRCRQGTPSAAGGKPSAAGHSVTVQFGFRGAALLCSSSGPAVSGGRGPAEARGLASRFELDAPGSC